MFGSVCVCARTSELSGVEESDGNTEHEYWQVDKCHRVPYVYCVFRVVWGRKDGTVRYFLSITYPDPTR